MYLGGRASEMYAVLTRYRWCATGIDRQPLPSQHQSARWEVSTCCCLLFPRPPHLHLRWTVWATPPRTLRRLVSLPCPGNLAPAAPYVLAIGWKAWSFVVVPNNWSWETLQRRQPRPSVNFTGWMFIRSKNARHRAAPFADPAAAESVHLLSVDGVTWAEGSSTRCISSTLPCKHLLFAGDESHAHRPHLISTSMSTWFPLSNFHRFSRQRRSFCRHSVPLCLLLPLLLLLLTGFLPCSHCCVASGSHIAAFSLVNFPSSCIFIPGLPSVLWHCWLGHVKPVPDMTCNVFGGTLNLAVSIYLSIYPVSAHTSLLYLCIYERQPSACDFLLVVYSNHISILNRFRDLFMNQELA